LNEGYTVVCAENGRQALDCLSGMTPALIILDFDDAGNEWLGIPRAAKA